MSLLDRFRMFADRGLTQEERRQVLEDLFVFGKKKQAPYLVRMGVLLVLSTIIATAGLLSDSAAVVIGAMLVAPLMNPVMAAAGAVVMGWSARFYGALWLVLVMGLGALLLSSAMTALSPDIVFLPEQVLARTRPTYYDLLIALAAGSAGAYTITRKETSAIPGVAVAVALLPPLASAGVLLTSGEHELALRALVLFLVNLIAMILSGALTFLAVGVSPATSRKKSSSFARTQIALFFMLTAAISVPLWFYSGKIIFNARYVAAKSEVLQAWLQENDMELVDVDILRERQLLYLSLAGPEPPVNIGELHDALLAQQKNEETVDFKIRYTWTQKIRGAWPREGQSIEAFAQRAEDSIAELATESWQWEFTQYSAESSAHPPAGDGYLLTATDDRKFSVVANCGKWTGKFTFGGKSLSIKMNRNWLSGCRGNDAVSLFLDDLERARLAFVDGERLKITLANEAGVMYFKRVKTPAG